MKTLESYKKSVPTSKNAENLGKLYPTLPQRTSFGILPKPQNTKPIKPNYM